MGNYVSSHDLVERMEEWQKLYQGLQNNVLKKHHVNRSAFFIMKIILDSKIRLKVLTALSSLDKSTLSRQVNALEKKKQIIKEPGKDKRYYNLSLSKETLALTNQILEELEETIGFILRGWPDEEKQLLLVLLGRVGRSMHTYEEQKKGEEQKNG